MSSTSPTRSAVIEMKDERRAMHEGHVFLDEKCLVLAAEILRQLAEHARLQAVLTAQHGAAAAALRQAVVAHGLQGLQVQPGAPLHDAVLSVQGRSLMGVPLQQATWHAGGGAVPAALDPSPEAQACRHAFAALLTTVFEAAAVAGNLQRLSHEYRRSVRRARALQDVLLPELDAAMAEVQTRLEELEQEDAIWMRQGARRAG